MPGAPTCLACGACCFSQLGAYVRVTGSDYARLGDAAADLTVFVGNQCFMRMDAGHCSALAVDHEAGFVCTTYSTRPEVCRTLGRESPECEAERTLKGARPQAARRVLLVI